MNKELAKVNIGRALVLCNDFMTILHFLLGVMTWTQKKNLLKEAEKKSSTLVI
jgi:hypothetical protein